MLDFFNIVGNSTADIQVFYSNNISSTGDWQTYRRPRGCSMYYILTVGSGGGGGGCNSTLTYGGGAGGGSGGISSTMILSDLLPDNLYLMIDSGGAGGPPNNNGSNGKPTYVCVSPDTQGATPAAGEYNIGINTVCVAYGGGGGAKGVGSNPGAVAGSGGRVATASDMILGMAGLTQRLSGQDGATGPLATTTNGLDITLPTNGIWVTGGASGAGSALFWAGARKGGDIVGKGLIPTIPGGAAGNNPGNNGLNQKFQYFSNGIGQMPLFCTGGSGGGTAGNSGCADGGHGGLGSGGGGGAAGSGGYSSTGGNGGGGLVIIAAW